MYIGITTFKERFDTHFKPLIESIKGVPTIVAVNSSYNNGLCNDYRREMLKLLSYYDNISPIFYQQMRGCSKMWNDLIIHSPTEHILILNDDVEILNTEKFLKNCNDHTNFDSFFKINGCFSHFVVSKKIMMKLGWFDERFLGFGEEDGDMMWRYIQTFKTPIPNYEDCNIKNLVSNVIDENIKDRYLGKYTTFNRCFCKIENNHLNLTCKYIQNSNGIQSTFVEPMINQLPNLVQYPYEEFYLRYKNSL
jgi:hypothetical protein